MSNVINYEKVFTFALLYFIYSYVQEGNIHGNFKLRF